MNVRVLGIALVLTVAAPAVSVGQEHAFSVRDDIEMTRFSNPLPRPGIGGSEIASASPDGRHYVIVTTKGMLKPDRVRSEVSIFDSGAVTRFLKGATTDERPRARVVAAIVSFAHHEEPYAYASAITDLRWSSDSSQVYFKAEELNGCYRLYRANIDGTGFHALTPAKLNVSQYDLVGDTVVFRASTANTEYASLTEIANPRTVTGERLQDLLFPHQLDDLGSHSSALWVLRKIKGTYRVSEVQQSAILDFLRPSGPYNPFSMSPDGRYLVQLVPAAQVPKSWEDYEPADGFEHLRYRSDDPRLKKTDNILRPKQYTLFDTVRGTQVPLIDAPNGLTLVYGDDNRVIWSPDSRRVLVTDTFLPLSGVSESERAKRTRPCAVASVDLQNLDTHCVIFNNDGKRTGLGGVNVVGAVFGTSSQEVDINLDMGDNARLSDRYEYHNGNWQLIGQSPRTEADRTLSEQQDAKGSSELEIRQSLNDAPTLWATDKATSISRMVWNPNPQFAHIRFGQASVYRWRDKNGYEWTGGLVKPAGYVPGKRYPLIIQMYMFFDHEFMTDGTDPTAFAARELASAGFVVLQIQKKAVHTYNDAEAQDHLEGYRSAIEKLSEDGLVDTTKVGVVGFSWTCWYVENALIKMPHLFAAATIADGLDHSYMNYLLFGISIPAIQEQDDRIIGAKPFGAGLSKWVEAAPGFHFDRVQTPLRIEAIDPLSLLGEWEVYSSLEMQDKPVDLIYFPKGTHIHQKPSDRFESQQGDVDWFRYWLQGYEDPDPTKIAQYKRWEHLRDLQDAEDKVDHQPATAKPN
jgi:dipeptidyl aminopeptidase/acylaminoacyl peptidase